jgi:hypothetical protein
LSPLLDRLLDGSFQEIESASGVVPFVISGQQFHQSWITVDGIQYSRFVRGIEEPINQQQKRLTQWQESSRKDIESTFGVLEGMFQFLDRPILLMDLKQISLRVTTCIILHNMLVSDRVMGQCGVLYNPSHLHHEAEVVVDRVLQPPDLATVQAGVSQAAPDGVSGIGIQNAPIAVGEAVTKRARSGTKVCIVKKAKCCCSEKMLLCSSRLLSLRFALNTVSEHLCLEML